MRETASSILQAMPQQERALLTPEKLGEIRFDFAKLSERWSALKIGESFTEQW